MTSHNSCQKLIGVEEGIIWSDETNPKKLITIWKREEYLTRCMKILSACLAIVLVVLIFYHFRLSFMELETTRKTIDSLERMQSEEMSLITNNDVELDEGKVEPKTPKAIAMTTEKINEASIEGISLLPEFESFSDPNNAPPTNISLSFPTLFETEDHEIPEASNDIDERILNVLASADETDTTTLNAIFRDPVAFESSSEEVNSESRTTENVIKIDEKIDHQETQVKVVNDYPSENDYDYSDYPSYSYDDSSKEDSEYTDIIERIPTPIIPEEWEEAPKVFIDFGGIIPDSLPPDSLSFGLNQTVKSDGDIDETDVTEGMENESSKQDKDIISTTDFVDEYFRELEATRLAEAKRLAEAGTFADIIDDMDDEHLRPEDYYNAYLDTWEEEDSEKVAISNSEKDTGQDTPSEDSSTIEPSSTPIEKKDSQGIDEITVNPATATSSESSEDSYEITHSFLDVFRLLCEPVYYWTSKEIDLLSDEMTQSEKSTIDKCFSLRKKNSNDKVSSIQSANKDSEETDTVTVDIESSEKSSKDSHETTDSLDDLDGDYWLKQIQHLLCEPWFAFSYQEIDAFSDILPAFNIYSAKRCMLLRNGGSDDAFAEKRFLWKRSIADELIREEIRDHRSASKAEQIMTMMKRVIQQDTQFLKDKESKISNPVVRSKVEDYYKKMEAVSAHIDQLQEWYLIKNELKDDYISRESPPQA